MSVRTAKIVSVGADCLTVILPDAEHPDFVILGLDDLERETYQDGPLLPVALAKELGAVLCTGIADKPPNRQLTFSDLHVGDRFTIEGRAKDKEYMKDGAFRYHLVGGSRTRRATLDWKVTKTR